MMVSCDWAAIRLEVRKGTTLLLSSWRGNELNASVSQIEVSRSLNLIRVFIEVASDGVLGALACRSTTTFVANSVTRGSRPAFALTKAGPKWVV